MKLRAAHNAKPVDIKAIESFPIPEDQKLTDGKNIINVAILRIYFCLLRTAILRAESKARRPIKPIILYTKEVARNDNLNTLEKKYVKSK